MLSSSPPRTAAISVSMTLTSFSFDGIAMPAFPFSNSIALTRTEPGTRESRQPDRSSRGPEEPREKTQLRAHDHPVGGRHRRHQATGGAEEAVAARVAYRRDGRDCSTVPPSRQSRGAQRKAAGSTRTSWAAYLSTTEPGGNAGANVCDRIGQWTMEERQGRTSFIAG